MEAIEDAPGRALPSEEAPRDRGDEHGQHAGEVALVVGRPAAVGHRAAALGGDPAGQLVGLLGRRPAAQRLGDRRDAGGVGTDGGQADPGVGDDAVLDEDDAAFCIDARASRPSEISRGTGVVRPQQDIPRIEQGGFTIVDEIYQGLTYDEAPFSALSLGEDIIVINSFSKYFNMTGWRLGWLVAPPAAVPDLEKLAQNLYISASSIAQHAALACFSEESMAIFEQRREAFRQRRDFLLPALRELGFRIEVEPQGAFYLYADVSAFTDDAQAFCAHFLETEHVAFTPGLDFGFHRANQHVRLAYTQQVPRLQEAVGRIARGLKRWQGSR